MAVSLATAGAYFVAGTTAGHPTPWWPYVLLLGLAVAGGLGYLFGKSEPESSVPAKVPAAAEVDEDIIAEPLDYFVTDPPESTPNTEVTDTTPGPVITDRWYHTSDGGKVPSLMSMTHTVMSHRGYGGRQSQDEPPSVKIGMLVACQPIDPSSSGTEMRAKFAAFLDSAVVRQLIDALTDVQPDMSWKNLAGRGPRTLEAALTVGKDPMEGVPVASALFLPPTVGETLYGRNGRAASLIFYVEPRTTDGRVPPATELGRWFERLSLAFAVPGAFADFLAKDLRLATFDDPPAQLGVWLESSPQPLTAMVDTDGLRVLPGSWPSSQFMGWAFSAPDGNSAPEAARDLMTQLCEYSLHLDGFEHAIAEAMQLRAKSMSGRSTSPPALRLLATTLLSHLLLKSGGQHQKGTPSAPTPVDQRFCHHLAGNPNQTSACQPTCSTSATSLRKGG